jgi:gliding motility-associated-like protein
MAKEIFFSCRLSFSSFIVLLVLLSSNQAKAQCAGQDNAITICDVPNPTSQTINLFALLGGTPITGGTWTDDDLSGGINTTTGILNAQQISQSGVYHFTYTVTGISGCADFEATITVTIGPNSGVTGPNASVCSDAGTFNLFQVFNGSSLSPQSNGTWFNNTSGVNIAGNSINIGSLGIGTFQFTYKVPAIGTCPARASSAFITVYRAPVSGIANDLLLCESDNLALYSNLNLNTRVVGEDAGGRWTETSGTNEITAPFDRDINVQNIYNTFGPGTYTFVYTVQPSNPICSPDTVSVNVIIERRLDFTGATLTVNSDICQTQIPTATYTAVINQGAQPIPNGTYNVTYQVSGPNGGTNSIVAIFNNGVLSFPLNASFFQQVGVFTVNITAITSTASLGACVNIINALNDTLTVSPTPSINNATVTIDPVCKNFGALVQIAGATSLPNGTYTLMYNLSGNNTSTAQTVIVTVNSGATNFPIVASLIPNVGNTQITFTTITNNVTSCNNAVTLASSFVVNPLPDPTNFTLNVNSVCLGQPVIVQMGGLGTLSNITISYSISGANTTATQTTTLAITAGNASFTIPAALIPNTGTSSLSVTDLTNTGNSCGTIINNLSDGFAINPLPVAPVASNQSFCFADNPTIVNLLPSGSQYQWFNSPTATTPLVSTTALASGTYYIREISPITGCQSPLTMISVIVNQLQTPVLTADGEKFCGLDKPTLQNLTNNTSSSGTVIWYDAPSGGNILSNTTLLQEGFTYYGFNTSTTNPCLSSNGLIVTVSLTNCTDPTVYDFFIPDGFSPNDDGINDSYSIPKIDFLFPNYTLEIYNRYGNLLFEGNKSKSSWDGKTEKGSTGGVAPNGVYFYVINFNKGNKAPLQGRLYLNR